MRAINIHEAKTHLSRLVEEAANGHSFIIAKAGKPMVKVVRIDPPDPADVRGRIGFLRGQFKVPDDFDQLGADEIARMAGIDE